jgi:hypothetical protein
LATKLRFQNYSPDLFDLIGLGLRTIALKIDFRRNAIFAKQVMAAAHALLETQNFKQPAQVIEPDGCIGGPAQDSLKDLVYRHFDILPMHLKSPRSCHLGISGRGTRGFPA